MPNRSAARRPLRALAATLVVVCGLAFGAGGETARPGGRCWPGPPDSDPDACAPDDPRYARHWEYRSDIPAAIDRGRMHPAEVANGAIGFSLDRAWQHTIGRDDVRIAVLDSGIRWREADLANKLWLNAGELPPPAGSPVHDANGDGVFDVRDYAADPRVGDRDGNGIVDPGDLIAAFSDCVDDDGNGYPDDICGFDFAGEPRCGFALGDNDPHDDTDFGHGTGIAATAAAETDNGLRDVGVCPRCRVVPIRVGDSFVVDANRFARGVAFAVASGASVIASALGSYNDTPMARDAIDLAWSSGVPLIASAADEFSYHHNFPSVHDGTLYVNAVRHDARDDPAEASTFWGLNPCTNFGARVWISVPATSCSSGATSRLAGVAGLLQSAARDAGLGALHAEEVYQVLRATADDLDNREPDWGGLRYPAKPGFDQIYGYGRLNARRAVQAVARGDVPPIVALGAPRWFAVLRPSERLTVPATIRLPRAGAATWRLEVARGVEPAEGDYAEIAHGSTDARGHDGPLAVLDLSPLAAPAGPPPRGAEDRDRFSVTLRLRVVDDRGRVAEARRSFFVLDDPTSVPHFPVDLGASGEAEPELRDLDGDGRDEILLPTADGFLHVVSADAAGLRHTRIALDPLPPLAPGRDGGYRETAVRGVAVGDLDGRGEPRIVLATRDGSVYVFSRRGERVPPFPLRVRTDVAPSPARVVESGALSRPVLADLDGRPGLEIVLSALDGRVHVWRHDGLPLDGFPITLDDPREPERRFKSVSTPAVGDLDGDGTPEIVVGSNGERDGHGAAYAIRARGTRDERGAFLPGWRPLDLAALRPGLLPTLGTGVAMDPALVDLDADGDHEVVLYAVTGGAIHVFDVDARGGPLPVARLSMRPGADSAFDGIDFLAGTGSPLVADADRDGLAEIYAPLLPLRMLTMRAKPAVPIDVPLALGGWALAGPRGPDGDVPMLSDHPRRIEDLLIFGRPAAADLDADGVAEILIGTGGYFLHAFSRAGGEAAGYPKFTGGWIFSTPATGDLDGDGATDVVTVTREGYLFAWRGGRVSDAPAGPAEVPAHPGP